MIEDVKDDVDKLHDSKFPQDAVRLFDKTDNRKHGVLQSSSFVDLIETHGRVGGGS